MLTTLLIILFFVWLAYQLWKKETSVLFRPREILYRANAHLSDVDASYWVHMTYAAEYSLRSLQSTLFFAIHALIPGIFITSGSESIRATVAIIDRRMAEARKSDPVVLLLSPNPPLEDMKETPDNR